MDMTQNPASFPCCEVPPFTPGRRFESVVSGFRVEVFEGCLDVARASSTLS